MSAENTASGLDNSYTYDSDGLRLTKTVGDVQHKYVWQGSRLVSENWAGQELEFFYDESGSPYAFSYKASATAAPVMYYYVTNLQGDVVNILDASGNIKASYTYNAWGEILSATGDMADINPLRYRGYYFDSDTGLYYLKARYYDPQLCRFINSDELTSTGQGVTGTNMFAYCKNNPVNRIDTSGTFWQEIGQFFSNTWNNISSWAKRTFGASSSTSVSTVENETYILRDPSPITVKTGIISTRTLASSGDSSKPLSVYANGDLRHPIRSSSAGIKVNISNFTLNVSFGLDNIGIYGSLSNGNSVDSFGLRINLSELKLGLEQSTSISWDNITKTTYTNVSANGWFLLAVYLAATTGQYIPSPASAMG